MWLNSDASYTFYSTCVQQCQMLVFRHAVIGTLSYFLPQYFLGSTEEESSLLGPRYQQPAR